MKNNEAYEIYAKQRVELEKKHHEKMHEVMQIEAEIDKIKQRQEILNGRKNADNLPQDNIR